ncbi:hypothetical protein VKT23_016904 [Stygiomarasmius scandens]|uniref:Crinkler effector protein N-terminal domain-containing protein n=1 Tax=Marasmiellus scandens TaxID=2682957 RepID=A0ABR1ITX6_9AGAR
MIKEGEPNDLKEINTDKLSLFKVSIPDEDNLAQKLEDAVKASKHLRLTTELTEIFPDKPPQQTIHIAVKLPDDALNTELGKSKHPSFERWRSKRLQSELPTTAELASFVDRPLSEEARIHISAAHMQALVTNIGEDLRTSDDVKLLFRLSDSEAPLDKIFVAVAGSPPAQGTENAFISFWDRNVWEILELLLPDGRSNRNSSQHTAARSLHPDYAFLLRSLCPFRGEEKA